MGDSEVRAADGINIHIEKGEFVDVKITEALDYDLVGCRIEN